MKNIFLATFCVLSSALLIAQSVGVNTTTPHSSAILDVQSNTKGMLIPRTSTTSRNAIANPAMGLMIYDTTTSGFWFYNGLAWTSLSAPGSAWNLNGNATVSANFIGSTNNQPLRFRVNNAWAGELHPTTGNVFLGLHAGSDSITGLFNTAIGNHSLFSNSSGSYNTAAGYYTLFSNTQGSGNTAQGDYALFGNTTGYNNTATGTDALNSNSSASENTAHGYRSLFSNINGYYNTANGSRALYSNNTGNKNTAMGYNALANNTGGNNNIAIGYGSGTATYAANVYNTISIGNDDLLNGYQNQVIIGNTSTGFIGGKVTWSTLSDARIKNHIIEDVKGLDFILRLRPVTYHVSNGAITALTGNKKTPDFPGKYDGEKIKYTGFLAQEVEQAAKAANYDFSGCIAPKNQTGLYTLSYEQFVVPLVKAVQEQQAIIEELKIEIELLKKKIF